MQASAAPKPPHRKTRRAAGRYTPMQIALHWLTAGLILAQFLFNGDIRMAFRQRLTADAAFWPAEISAVFHMLSGGVILLFLIARIFLRSRAKAHPVPDMIPPWLHKIATLAHLMLYLAVVLMAVLGVLAWVMPSPVMAELHELGRWAVTLLILAHIGGALFEHYMIGNPVLDKITGSPD